MSALHKRLLKLLVLAGVIAFVASRVQWRDELHHLGADNKVLRVEVGSISGPWNSDQVQFTGEDGAARQLRRGAQPDGTKVELSPGLLTYWRTMDLWLFAAGAFCYFLTVIVAGSRWWWLLRCNGMQVSFAEAMRFTWIGIFFNTVVPGQTGGDLVRALYIMKHCPGQRVPALVSVIVDRVLGLASLALLGAVVVLFALDDFGDLALAIWGVMLGVGLLFVVAFSRRLRQLVRLRDLLLRLPKRVGHALQLVDQAVFVYRGHKRVIFGSLLAGVANHVLSILSVVLIGDALGVGVPWFEYFVLIPIINIVSAVPIGPNGWGVGELMYQHLFGTYCASYATGVADPVQVMGTRGVALSVLYRIHLSMWSLVGGLVLLFERDRVTKADIDQEIRREEQD